MLRQLLLIGLIYLSLGAWCRADIIIRISESDDDILITTTGSLNTTGLTGHQDANNFAGFGYNWSTGSGFEVWLAFGGSNPGQDFYAGDGDGLVGYTSDVSWTGGSASSLSVDLVSGYASFGFRTGNLPSIWIPDNYVNGSAVSQVLRKNNDSFASLGLNVGDYARVSWTGTGGGSGDSIMMVVVPEPATGVLFSMLGIAGFLNRRRKS